MFESRTPTVPKGASSRTRRSNGAYDSPFRRGWEADLSNLSRPETLEDLRELLRAEGRSASDHVSAFNTFERVSGRKLSEFPLDYELIRRAFADAAPAAKNLSPLTWRNVKSRCNVAIKRFLFEDARSGLPNRLLSASWQAVLEAGESRHEKYTLSSFARWANALGVEPHQIRDEHFEQFERWRSKTMRPDKRRYQRSRVKIWNALSTRAPQLALSPVGVNPLQRSFHQVRWASLPESFRVQFDMYGDWAMGKRLGQSRTPRLSASSLFQHKHWLLAAVDTLVKNGVDIQSFQTVDDVLTLERITFICQQRFENAQYRDTSYNFSVARTLLSLAKWRHSPELDDIEAYVASVKAPEARMAPKNLKTIRPFDDPKLKKKLLDLPERLFSEARSDLTSKRSRLCKLQAGMAIAVLTLFALRIGNVSSLSFDEHMQLETDVPTLIIPEDEVKNGLPLEFDIPPHLVRLLKAYRDDLCPQLTGIRPTHLFIDTDGHVKLRSAVRTLVTQYMKSHLGVRFNPHAFRHLAARWILDVNPGAYPIVQDLLAHSSLRTTAEFYAGPNTRRAGRHHLKLLMADWEESEAAA
jgi:integrase